MTVRSGLDPEEVKRIRAVDDGEADSEPSVEGHIFKAKAIEEPGPGPEGLSRPKVTGDDEDDVEGHVMRSR